MLIQYCMEKTSQKTGTSQKMRVTFAKKSGIFRLDSFFLYNTLRSSNCQKMVSLSHSNSTWCVACFGAYGSCSRVKLGPSFTCPHKNCRENFLGASGIAFRAPLWLQEKVPAKFAKRCDILTKFRMRAASVQPNTLTHNKFPV